MSSREPVKISHKLVIRVHLLKPQCPNYLDPLGARVLEPQRSGVLALGESLDQGSGSARLGATPLYRSFGRLAGSFLAMAITEFQQCIIEAADPFPFDQSAPASQPKSKNQSSAPPLA